ncbi:Uncharacterised protein [Enterococcus casseliflavus]|uniref:DUF6271 family protein n=1 Tax=Enterococcus casseliflavus TaxID=37734 RepID=UPI000E052D3E|nr:DUF6271 family protein [Enterococcus casseliflavus]GEB30290.1 hypothetical protein ECA02_33850 [Enterococcus casseliflavus]STP33402.1 Uncharacterised protein [Enterococcus casseliflavus]
MELFCIPTHRKIDEALNSILLEMDYFMTSRDVDVALLVIENGSKEVFSYNQKLLESLEASFNIFHLGLHDLKNIVVEISEHSEIPLEVLSDLLFPDSVDYGKMANFIYIISCILNADGIHRRDSDCVTISNQSELFPIKQELNYLGKKIKEAQSLTIDPLWKKRGEDEILVVGGDYAGDWDVELEEISQLNDEAMKEYMKLVGFNGNESIKTIKEKYIEREAKGTRAFLSSVFDPTHVPECGNVSLREIHKFIPCFIGQNTIGVDYHTTWSAFEIGCPVVFHENKMNHMYDAQRKKSIDNYGYWRGLIKMIDFDNFHLEILRSGFFEKHIASQDDSVDRGLKSLISIHEHDFPNQMELTLKHLNRETRLNRIESVIDNILFPAQSPKYIAIAEELNTNKSFLIDEMNNDYTKSILLQRYWKKIVDSCRNIKLERSK